MWKKLAICSELQQVMLNMHLLHNEYLCSFLSKVGQLGCRENNGATEALLSVQLQLTASDLPCYKRCPKEHQRCNALCNRLGINKGFELVRLIGTDVDFHGTMKESYHLHQKPCT